MLLKTLKSSIDLPPSLPFTVRVSVLLMALFQVAKQNYANGRQKSESPNACYSPLNGISHAGHITRGWDL